MFWYFVIVLGVIAVVIVSELIDRKRSAYRKQKQLREYNRLSEMLGGLENERVKIELAKNPKVKRD